MIPLASWVDRWGWRHRVELRPVVEMIGLFPVLTWRPTAVLFLR